MHEPNANIEILLFSFFFFSVERCYQVDFLEYLHYVNSKTCMPYLLGEKLCFLVNELESFLQCELHKETEADLNKYHGCILAAIEGRKIKQHESLCDIYWARL